MSPTTPAPRKPALAAREASSPFLAASISSLSAAKALEATASVISDEPIPARAMAAGGGGYEPRS